MTQVVPTILLVEDEPDILLIIHRLISHVTGGFDIVTVSNGLEALEHLSHRHISLIVTDYNMPVMNGLQFARVVSELYSWLPIIMITAYATPELERRARAAGLWYYLPKPFPLDRFEQIVREVVVQGKLALSGFELITTQDPMLVSGSIVTTVLAAAATSSLTLLIMRIEGQQKLAASAWATRMRIPAKVDLAVKVSDAEVAMLVEQPAVEDVLDTMLEQFYGAVEPDHPELALTYGYASGPVESVERLIITAARDLVERRASQGLSGPAFPASVLIVPRLMGRHWQHGDHRAQLEALRRASLAGPDPVPEAVRSQIEALTAVMHHDLNSAFGAMAAALRQAEEALPAAQAAALRAPLLCCQAWQQSIVELGAGRIDQRQSLGLQGWLSGTLTPLARAIAPGLAVSVQVEPSLTAYLDPQPLLVALLYQLLALRQAGAARLSARSERGARGHVSLVFEDDGEPGNRARTLLVDGAAGAAQGLPPELALARGALAAQGVAVDVRMAQRAFQLLWRLPDPPAPPQIMTGAEIDRELAEMEREMQEIERARKALALQLAPAARPAGGPPAQPPEGELRPADLLVPRLVPLTAALEDLLRVAAGPGVQSEQAQHAALRIQRLSRYSALLVRNLMFALAGKAPPPERVDLNREIIQVLDILEHKLSALRLTLQLSDTPAVVSVASVEAKQLLTNLLKNAAEAMRPGGQLAVTTLVRDRRVIIQIRDSGHGIAEADAPHIFDLRFSTRGRGGNSGIGLFIVWDIVVRAGGTVAVSSCVAAEGGALRSWQSGPIERADTTWEASGTLFHLSLPWHEDH